MKYERGSHGGRGTENGIQMAMKQLKVYVTTVKGALDYSF